MSDHGGGGGGGAKKAFDTVGGGFKKGGEGIKKAFKPPTSSHEKRTSSSSAGDEKKASPPSAPPPSDAVAPPPLTAEEENAVNALSAMSFSPPPGKPGGRPRRASVLVAEMDYSDPALEPLQREEILEKHQTVHWPKGNFPEDGRLYLTREALYFVGVFHTKKRWTWNGVAAEREGTMGGMVKNAIRITEVPPVSEDDDDEEGGEGGEGSRAEEKKESDGGGSGSHLFTFLLSRRNRVYDRLAEMIATAPSPGEEGASGGGGAASGGAAGAAALPKVPPDRTLSKMSSIVKKRLRGVSVSDFYDVVWSEGEEGGHDKLYGPWLEKHGKEDVKVNEWKMAKEGEAKFENEWCGEEYDRKRTVTFTFKKFGTVECTHTQHCRVETQDKCVLHMTVNMKGIPFADSFDVQVRWVASRVGTNDLSLTCGLFVNFKKSCMVEGKIRKNTTQETTSAQSDLFESMKSACKVVAKTDAGGGADGAAAGDVDEEEEEEGGEVASASRGLPGAPDGGAAGGKGKFDPRSILSLDDVAKFGLPLLGLAFSIVQNSSVRSCRSLAADADRRIEELGGEPLRVPDSFATKLFPAFVAFAVVGLTGLFLAGEGKSKGKGGGGADIVTGVRKASDQMQRILDKVAAPGGGGEEEKKEASDALAPAAMSKEKQETIASELDTMNEALKKILATLE